MWLSYCYSSFLLILWGLKVRPLYIGRSFPVVADVDAFGLLQMWTLLLGVADVDAFVGRCRYEPVQIWTFSVCCRYGRFVADMDVLGVVFVLS